MFFSVQTYSVPAMLYGKRYEEQAEVRANSTAFMLVAFCRTCTEVVSGIVSKCFNSKPRLREVGVEVCLMYVEIDKNEQVQDEIMKGFENKQPKIVNACVDMLTTALR